MRTLHFLILLTIFIGRTAFSKENDCLNLYDMTEEGFQKNMNGCKDEFFNKDGMSSKIGAGDLLNLSGSYSYQKGKITGKVKLTKDFKKLKISSQINEECSFSTDPLMSLGGQHFYIESDSCYLRGFTIPGSNRLTRIILYNKKTDKFLVTGSLSRISL